MKISYSWLKSYVPDISEPNKLADIFTYHICEVESVEKSSDGDHVFDLGILPNRAHDLLSHIGVAKELSGLLGVPFKDPTPMYKTPVSKPTELKINIETDKCRRYMGRIVRNVKVGPSAEWVVKNLESIGQRSINNIVDATNIVMHDCGQPAHAFDLRKIKNNSINIINAKNDEELKLVGRDQATAKLKDTDLVAKSEDETLEIVGVKGGLESGVQNDTTDILIEIANFDPTSIRKTARRIGQLSDAAKRFENNLSPTLCDFGMFSLSALLVELFPDAQFEDIVDVYQNKPEEKKVKFSRSYVDKILGIKISEKDIEDILTRYEFRFTKESDSYSVIVPPLRLDLLNREDMAEEIGRIYGYDKVKPAIPLIEATSNSNPIYNKIVQARKLLINEGYREVMTYTFANEGEVEILASASDKNFLRTNLSDGLKEAYELNKLNAPFLGLDEIKIFEIGTVFHKDGEQINVAYANKKEIKEIPLNEYISSEVDFEKSSDILSDIISAGQTISKTTSDLEMQTFKIWSAYPFITRDIAVWVPEGTLPQKLKDIYHEFGTELLIKEPILVDTFTKEGRTSFAFRLLFQSYDRTLTTEEVNLIMGNITEKLSKLGWEVR